MVTYVINTSENKTFDSEILFDLAGYNKIKWMQYSLNDIKVCAENIYEKQNVLGADRFRIAVIVDFYNFDRIRPPYGRRGFGQESGVDMSLYMPYIEIFLLDNLIHYLEIRDMIVADFEVYYVQNEKNECYELLESAETQIRQILSGEEFAYKKIVQIEKEEEAVIPLEGLSPCKYDVIEKEVVTEEKLVMVDVEEDYYKSFKLYCTPAVSLLFRMADFPYGFDEMTFSQFWRAFRQRISAKNQLRRHHYISSYGGGASRAAFDTLSLSLYLIRMYEREEMVETEGEMEVIHLEATVLKEVLESAWCKVDAAKVVAKKNNLQYYSLYQKQNTLSESIEESNIDIKYAVAKERASLPKEVEKVKLSIEDAYREVCAFATRSSADIKSRNRKEFDKIMSEYLRKRDKTRESDIEAEFNSLRELGLLKMTDQSPSRNDYENIVDQKEKEISAVFKRILAAEYIEVDYKEEKEKADAAYLEYKKMKAWMHRNIIGDVIFMILAIAAMMVPYCMLQLTAWNSSVISSVILGLLAAGIFEGLFICSVIFQLMPLLKKMKKAKRNLRECYLDCSAKERYSFSSIRQRYENDLIYIEQIRYELRQLKHLYDVNCAKNLNVRTHRKMLEELEDCLSAMLNNLDVEAKRDPNETVEGEFDLSKPIRSKENKVYQIFSIETIEKMFPKKGCDAQ